MPKSQQQRQIIDQVSVPQNPSGTVRELQPIAAEAMREYVSGGTLTLLATYIRALPRYIDDLTMDDDSVYDTMLQDAQVESCVEVLKNAALAPGVRLTPATQPGEDRNGASQRAVEVCDFCRRNLDTLDTPLEMWLYDMLDAICYGHRVSEQIYRQDGGQLLLAKLKVRPKTAYAFVIDPWHNIIGLLGLIPGVAFPVLSNSLMDQPQNVPNLLPRSKFAILTHRGRASDPRGTSGLRPAYNAWYLKRAAWAEYLKFLVRFASPSLIGVLPEGAQAIYQTDPTTGDVVLDATGAPVTIDPAAQMLETLQAFANASATVVPYGAEVKPIQFAGEGARVYQTAIDLFDRQIAKAITGQTLATEEGEHQARAAASVHQDTLSQQVGYIRRLACAMIQRDVLQPLVRYNFGTEALALTPQVSMDEPDAPDFANEARALGSLGYRIDPSQWAELDARLGLPARDPASIQREQERLAGPPQPPAEPPEPGGDEEIATG